MGIYHTNKQRAKTVNVGTTKTDQSHATSTDINVIVRQHAIHGQVPGSAHPPMYGDFSEIPDNLRDMIELGRSMENHKNALPPALRSMTVEELVTTPPDKLQARIKEEKTYLDRHGQLPNHLKSLSRHDILNLSEKEFSAMIHPQQPVAPEPKPETK